MFDHDGLNFTTRLKLMMLISKYLMTLVTQRYNILIMYIRIHVCYCVRYIMYVNLCTKTVLYTFNKLSSRLHLLTEVLFLWTMTPMTSYRYAGTAI